MPLYSYKAANRGGDVLEGQMEAASVEAVIRQLRSLGQIPIRAEPAEASAGRKHTPHVLLGRRKVTRRDITELTLELATLLESGLSLDKSLAMLVELSDKEAKRELLSRIHAEVHGGAYLSRALASQGRLFSPFYCNMVKAGEATGALGAALERLAEFLERSRKLREAVVSALIYPVILLAVGCLSMFIILGFVIPRISEMFDQAGRALPWFTQLVVASGDFVQHYGWALVLALAGGFFYARRLLERPPIRLRWDAWLLGLPLVGNLISTLEAARFTRTLGTLVGGGVPLLDAIAIAKAVVANRVIAMAIDRAGERARQGEGLARPLREEDVLPKLAGHLLEVGEQTGNLEKMLMRLGEIHEREVQVTLRRLMAVLEPALIVGLAVVIAAIILSIVAAIFSVNDLAF